MNPNVAVQIRSQNPQTDAEFVTATDTFISGSRLGRSHLWNSHPQNLRSNHWTPTHSQSLTSGTSSSPASPTHKQSWTEPSFGLANPHSTINHHSQQQQDRPTQQSPRPPHRLSKYFDKDKGAMCFQCKKWGHIGAECPERSVLSIATQLDDPRNTNCLPNLFAMGEVLETPAHFFLDSGADHSVININLVNQLKELGVAVPASTSSNVERHTW